MNQLMGITDWYFMPQVSRTIRASTGLARRGSAGQ